MPRLFVRHRVQDFDRWFAGYSRNGQLRDSNGVTGQAVYTGVDDRNDVTVWHDFATREEAEAFAALPELAERMREIGVEGEPQIWIADPVG